MHKGIIASLKRWNYTPFWQSKKQNKSERTAAQSFEKKKLILICSVKVANYNRFFQEKISPKWLKRIEKNWKPLGQSFYEISHCKEVGLGFLRDFFAVQIILK